MQPKMRALLSFAITAFATIELANAANLEAITYMNGSCKKLVIDGENKTTQCSGRLMQLSYDSGRIGFYVFGDDKSGFAVTFSGFDGKPLDENTHTQDLDMVLVNSITQGGKPVVNKVKGTCTFNNPFIAPMLITCNAKDEQQKEYSLGFITDGKLPEIKKFNDGTDKFSDALKDTNSLCNSFESDDPDVIGLSVGYVKGVEDTVRVMSALQERGQQVSFNSSKEMPSVMEIMTALKKTNSADKRIGDKVPPIGILLALRDAGYLDVKSSNAKIK